MEKFMWFNSHPIWGSYASPLRTVKFRSFERPTPKKMVKRSYRRTTQWQSSWASIGQGRWVTFHDQLRVIFPPGCRSSQGIELTFAGSLAGSKIEGLKKSGCLTSWWTFDDNLKKKTQIFCSEIAAQIFENEWVDEMNSTSVTPPKGQMVFFSLWFERKGRNSHPANIYKSQAPILMLAKSKQAALACQAKYLRTASKIRPLKLLDPCRSA